MTSSTRYDQTAIRAYAEEIHERLKSLLGGEVKTFNRQEDRLKEESKAFCKKARNDKAIPPSKDTPDDTLAILLTKAELGLNRGAMLCNEIIGFVAHQMITDGCTYPLTVIGFFNEEKMSFSHVVAIIGLQSQNCHNKIADVDQMNEYFSRSSGIVVDFWNKENPIYPLQDLNKNLTKLRRDGQLDIGYSLINIQLHSTNLQQLVTNASKQSSIHPAIHNITGFVEKTKAETKQLSLLKDIAPILALLAMKNQGPQEQPKEIIALLTTLFVMKKYISQTQEALAPLINATKRVNLAVNKVLTLADSLFPKSGGQDQHKQTTSQATTH
jgi:hypothetical protein